MHREMSNTVKINEFLSSHSRKRNLDEAFKNWFARQDSSNPEKSVAEWQELLNKFFKE